METETILKTPAAPTTGEEATAPGDVYLGPESRRALVNRLARIEGHVRALSRMVDERACADEILLQVSAVKGALSRFGAILVEEELGACVATCIADDPAGAEERVDKLGQVLTAMLRRG